MSERHPSAAALRVRRYRKRLQEGRICLVVEVADEIEFVDALVASRRLAPNFADHRDAIAAQAARVLAEWARAVTRYDADPLDRLDSDKTNLEAEKWNS